MISELNLAKGDLLDTHFNVVPRWGVKWCLLSLTAPLYTLFGQDAFSHSRVQNVGKAGKEFVHDHFAHLKPTFRLLLNSFFSDDIGRYSRRKEELVEFVKGKYEPSTDQKAVTVLSAFVDNETNTGDFYYHGINQRSYDDFSEQFENSPSWKLYMQKRHLQDLYNLNI